MYYFLNKNVKIFFISEILVEPIRIPLLGTGTKRRRWLSAVVIVENLDIVQVWAKIKTKLRAGTDGSRR
jgi:hypothetical protein